jgi:hypothetical protein
VETDIVGSLASGIKEKYTITTTTPENLIYHRQQMNLMHRNTNLLDQT